MPDPVAGPPGFPDSVPVLVDAGCGLTLRAHGEQDLVAIVEQCRDPQTVAMTTVPTPYGLPEAGAFLTDVVAPGWDAGTVLGWALEAERDGRAAFCGSVDLRLQGDGVAEIGFGLHPAARGRGLMAAATRLVRDYAFDVCDLRVLRWRAVVGNWGSRRVAAAAGFRFDGTVRGLLVHRGEVLDGWLATMTAEDSRVDLGWSDPPRLTGETVVLRPFRDDDVGRIVKTSQDEETRHWLVSLPSPYSPEDASAFIEAAREDAAQRTGLTWCIADPVDDCCLGSISLDGFGQYHRRSEIGYSAHPDARGRGVVSAALRVVTRYAEESLGRTSLLVRCAAGNLASRRVAAAAGYREVGALRQAEPLGDGSITDLVLYARP